VTEERNREHTDRRGDEDSAVYQPPSSSSDLLDLVRSAEDDARLALRKRTPAVPMHIGTNAAALPEEFVDVGDEAIDAPPSLPPLRAATPAIAFAIPGASSSTRVLAREVSVKRGWSPAAGIVLVLALAIGTLLVLAR
jgi:hypothetical protein